MRLNRTIFKNEIIAEYFAPVKPSGNVIILCDGLPTVPSKDKVIKLFAKKGYWVFHPRYRGTWESKGVFLEKSPYLDIVDVIDELSTGFKNLYDNQQYKIDIKKIIVVGASFGGACALMSSLDKRVNKVVAIAPVVDWTKVSEENITTEQMFISNAFGMAYRYSRDGLDNLINGKFLNPIDHINEFDKNKIFIIHAKNDDLVPFEPSYILSNKVGCKFIALKKGEHLTASILLKKRFFSKVKKFIKE